MSSNPRWWRIAFGITVGLLSLAVTVFLWAFGLDLLGAPTGTENEEWFKLGAAIVSALSGSVLIAVLLALLIVRWIRASRTRSSSAPQA